MKIHFNHIASYIDDSCTIADVSKSLFHLGHENEYVDDIFDIELTPNRGDCLSLLGILRELNVFNDINHEEKIYSEEIKEFDFNFVNHLNQSCPYISFLKIEIEDVPNKYNGVLKDYFKDLGIKSNNFFTDVSNYISYETGQPTHCYDASKVSTGLQLKELNNKTKFHTLFDEKLILDSGDIVFTTKDEVINLAGIIGGMSSSCSKSTKETIVECAFFKPESIIGKSIKYDVNSDAAHKFERGVDAASHEYVLRRFIKIISENASLKNVEIKLNSAGKFKSKTINFSNKELSKIIGQNVDETKSKNHLKKLGFKIEADNVYIPSYRNDIHTMNDLAEEIARVIGYDNIKPKSIKMPKVNLNHQDLHEDKIKNFLVCNGFYEVINNPFVSKEDLDSINLDNPLDSNKKLLRTDLEESLLSNLLYNERRQKDSIKLFEVSDIYTKKDSCVNRSKKIGIIASGRVDKNYKEFSKKIDTTYLDMLFKPIIQNKEINFKNIKREFLDTKIKNKIFYLETVLSDLSSNNTDTSKKQILHNKKFKFKPVSEFPTSTRDLSYSVKDFSKSEILESLVMNFKNEIIKEIFIFDFYINEKNKEIKIGFRFIFQSNDRTLKDDEVDKVMDYIIMESTAIDSVEIPGLIQ